MDIRRQVLPFVCVTSANQHSAVKTCQSTTCVSSGFGQPVNTSVQATPSIRNIQPNTVKSRAQVFEKKDTDVPKELLPSRTVIGGNNYAKTNESAENRHLIVQPSKSAGQLDQRDRMTKFTYDTQRSPECQNRPFPVSSVEPLSSKMPSDIVTQRLRMFENKPVTSSKPAPLPKPRSPDPFSGTNPVSLCRSRSSDSVKQSDMNWLVKPSFHSPSGERLQVLPQDPASRMTNKNILASDRDASIVRRKSADRQVFETVVVNPLPSSSSRMSVKIISPKPPIKPAKEVNSAIPSRNEVINSTPSPSSVESSKVVTPKPPEKPPRMLAASADAVNPMSVDSYGLLVCATGAPSPSVHVEKLAGDVPVPDNPPLPKISPKPTVSVPGAVLNTSRLQNNNAVQSNAASELTLVTDAWDKMFIRGPKSSPVVRSKGEKENFVTKKRMNNPSYMYVHVHTDDIIPSRKKIVPDKQTLTRHHSADMLNIPPAPTLPSPKSPCYKEPLYAVPFEFDAVDSQITFDSAGYAMPHLLESPQFKRNTPVVPPKQRNFVQQAITAQQRHNIQAKVSNAYSILRLNFVTPDSSDSSSGVYSVGDQEIDGEIDLEEHRRRLRHVSRVKEATYKDVSNYEKVRMKCGDQQLFEYAMIVTLQASHDGLQPRVLFCFPHQVSATDQLTSYFCFPEADELQPMHSYTGESFSFLLTNATGGRKYGWCYRYLPFALWRQICLKLLIPIERGDHLEVPFYGVSEHLLSSMQPPGDGPRLLEALVIVSQIGERNLYKQLLDKVRVCRFMSLTSAEEMLQVAYARPFPAPNKEVYIRTVGPDYAKLTFIIKRDAETPYNNVSFSTLLAHLSVDKLLQVFSSLLLERKVIFCSKHLSTLSTCMSTVAALLYPFEWQHTFITVLPSMLIDIVDAPTPYIVGVLASMKELLEDHCLTEVIFVDLDAKRLQSVVGDEGRIIPKKIQKALIAALTDDTDGPSVSAASVTSAVSHEATVAEAFLRMFVETCGHYESYINTQQNGERIFQRELFVQIVSSNSIRMFLEWFTLTQMFDVFITDRLKHDFVPGYFEKRVMDYREEMKQLAHPLRENMKVFGKKIVGFLRDYGGKIKK